MNKIDIVFYLSTLSGVGSAFVKLTTNLISTNTAAWIGVISTLVGLVAFAFYEKFNGVVNPPPQPPIF